ncbi:uncharacterized protein LOC133034507 [Cannabis sativa]|uniref:uncharacterized protein LOC133034507 n=1 Tax=Cannabis sativa TaxID=3483 RepID=UPI0029C9F9C4|nr:uncharacterized protein LOC133034507 [Cannabis sativa]
MERFWWHSKSSYGSGIHWKSWDKLCLHKHKGGLGFRNLRNVNLSMLGKHGWRLLTNSSSLVVRVFQARYYPQGTFLDAELGSNPSYAWRSVFEAQEIVKLGARWRVGSGISILVLNQPWLSSKDNPYVVSSHEALCDCSVFNLLQIDNMSWDEELLEDLFVQRDVELIRSIPLPSTLNMDTWYWAYEAYGGCSIKSAYPALQVRNERWNLQDNSGFWKKFCICSLCNGELETIYHIMVWCPFTKACMDRGLGFSFSDGKDEFSCWFECFCNTHLGDSVDKIAVILWDVWGARNDFLWNKKIASVERVVSAAITYLELWKFAQIKMELSRHLLVSSRPVTSSGLNPAAVKSSGDLKPFMAEAMSLKEALSWVKNTWGDGASFEGFVPMRW